MTQKLLIKNLSALPEIINQILLMFLETMTRGGATVVGLSGDLGAGKTTFVQALALALGVKETVQSPTFTILKIYQTNHPEFRQLIHMDAYRIESLTELEPLRFQELLDSPATLFCIEWSEKIIDALPGHILLEFKTQSAESRELTVTSVEKTRLVR